MNQIMAVKSEELILNIETNGSNTKIFAWPGYDEYNLIGICTLEIDYSNAEEFISVKAFDSEDGCIPESFLEFVSKKSENCTESSTLKTEFILDNIVETAENYLLFDKITENIYGKTFR